MVDLTKLATKITQRKWSVKPSQYSGGVVYKVVGAGKVIVRLDFISSLTDSEGKANATAMALVPELIAEVLQLRDTVNQMQDEQHKRFLEWRSIETACSRCSGVGKRAYASTATWHGGIGGAAITNGVCDACWGSGDACLKGADLRALEKELQASMRSPK